MHLREAFSVGFAQSGAPVLLLVRIGECSCLGAATGRHHWRRGPLRKLLATCWSIEHRAVTFTNLHDASMLELLMQPSQDTLTLMKPSAGSSSATTDAERSVQRRATLSAKNRMRSESQDGDTEDRLSSASADPPTIERRESALPGTEMLSQALKRK